MLAAIRRLFQPTPLRFGLLGALMGVLNPLGTVVWLWVFEGLGMKALKQILREHPMLLFAEALTGATLMFAVGFWVGWLLLRTQQERENYRRRAAHDSLTGLLNHRHVLDRLGELARDPRGASRSFCVVMLDIDFFKQINDTHGHPVGDEVLRQLSQLLLDSVRDTDLVGRYGGEEFLIVLTQTDLAGAGVVLGRLLQLVRRFRFHGQAKKAPSFHLTITLGVSHSSEMQDQNALALVELADERLLKGKREGRDRVVWPPGFAPVNQP